MLPHTALPRESRISLSAGAACAPPVIFPIYLLHWLIQRPFPSRSPSLMIKYVVEGEARGAGKGRGTKGGGGRAEHWESPSSISPALAAHYTAG